MPKPEKAATCPTCLGTKVILPGDGPQPCPTCDATGKVLAPGVDRP